MTVPTYEEFMLPTLRALADGQPRTTRATADAAADLRLARLMVDHGVGVQVASSHVLKRLDQDYFDEL